MKFTRGYWLNKPGVENFDCVQIREIRVENGKVYLYSVPYPQDERGMGGPVLEMDISSPRRDIIRTEAWHFKGSAKKAPEFELETEDCPLETEKFEGGITLRSGDTSLRITCRPASFTYYYKGKKLTNVGDKFGHSMISYMQTPEGPFMRAQLDLDIGEKVYGLGERFTPFVRNGQVVDLWQEDGGTCSEISYKNIPFYLTNRGYGVFVNSSGPVSYEICSEVVTRAQFSVPGEKLDFMVIGGGEPKEVLHNYTALTGRPALPPAWTFGLWLSTSFTTNYDEDTVNEFVNGMAERDIPLEVFHFDCYWMAENEWCNFTFDPKMFKDAPGMLKRLKERGLRICVWINSYIGQKSPLFREAMELGYLLKRPNGDVWQWDLWQAGMGLVDFTNPGAWKWYQDKLRGLLDMGVDCFKTDFGERIPTDCVYYDGSDPELMHNYYTYLYNKCVFELLEEYKGRDEACLFARSATAGGQKFPVHWGGDCSSNYLSMSESLRAGLSLTCSGFGFWSHDISGFEGTAPADVYKRWAAFGLLSTHSRLHGSNSYRVPWLFDEESVDVVRKFTKLKCSLMPYLYSKAVEAHRTGVPMMRAMVLEFPQDIACGDLDRQYMLGESLLVAPVFTKEGDVDYYLPEGRWTNLLSGEVVTGGRWVHEVHDFMSLPLMVRENTILPVGALDSTVEYDYSKGLTLHVFELNDEAQCEVVDMNGEKFLTVTAKNVAGKVSFHFEGQAEGLKIVLHGADGERVVEVSTDLQDLTV
ncbi:alpha-xylosidase [Acutalibacter sp. 1XD8-36]|uniref:alpha-xylosidase n=1 Tax=Acutalibacter sp. 1XD8-36 TaxID=2320852 RepID=UPI001411FF9D|nr:alpha-xylosidase [Acutalibacter sp. 1XD8-36]NBJ89292.1 alpha-xylosidase [Acutalibacter sp. 1XD8-36]